MILRGKSRTLHLYKLTVCCITIMLRINHSFTPTMQIKVKEKIMNDMWLRGIFQKHFKSDIPIKITTRNYSRYNK